MNPVGKGVDDIIDRVWRTRRMAEDKYVVIQESETEFRVKIAAAKASPVVVGVLSRNLPVDMAEFKVRRYLRRPSIEIEGELVYWGAGIIIECEPDPTTLNYLSIIITPATLFFRTNGVQPSDIKVDVYLWNDMVCQAQVLACDFHYNLAALLIITSFPLQTATLRPIEHVLSVRPNHRLRSNSLFEVSPNTNLVTLGRSFTPRNAPLVGSEFFSEALRNAKLDCNELYRVTDNGQQYMNQGAVLNYLGEVIGLLFYQSSFLPINIVSIWWEHFKSFGQHRRPWLGMEIANLHSSSFNYLEEFMRVFPDVTEGVVVTKVFEDSPCPGICPNDVILKCDGKLVCNSLKFFEMVWNKFEAKSVHLDVLRSRNGQTLKLKLTIQETSPDKFYKWERTDWHVLPAVKNWP